MKRLIAEAWTDDSLLLDAKKSNTPAEWMSRDPSAYNAARTRGPAFLIRCYAHMERVIRPWTPEGLMVDAEKYTSKAAWRKGNAGAYSSAKRRGAKFLAKCCAHMVPGHKTWTNAALLAEAKRFVSKSDWATQGSGSRAMAIKRGKKFYERCCAHMVAKLRAPWTDEELLAVAKRYPTKVSWKDSKDGGAYQVAQRRGRDFMERCCAHMNGNFRWTDKSIAADAKKYRTRTEWFKGSPGYKAAKRRGVKFLAKCCAHMKDGRSK
jgi:hypothetical protein